MLYIFYGQDDFSLREALERVKGGLGDPGLLEVNTTTLDGRKLSVSELRNAVDTVPFLSQKRLVIVEGLLGHFERRRKGRQRRPALSEPAAGDRWQAFSTCIEATSPSTVLILVDGSLKRDNPLLRQLSPLAEVKTFPYLEGSSLQNWIRARVKRYGGSISPQAVRALVELVGGNLWAMANEIEKLLLYTSGRSIEESDVQKLVSYSREANIFTMVDALLQGQATAGWLLSQLLEDGAAPAYLLFMITRELRLLVQMKELRRQGVPLAEIQNRLGLPPGYPLRKTLAHAVGHPMERLREAYSKLLETDLAIKTGILKDELALDLLVAELSLGRP